MTDAYLERLMAYEGKGRKPKKHKTYYGSCSIDSLLDRDKVREEGYIGVIDRVERSIEQIGA